ncbi:MAG: glycosyltransferase [Bifidobacterium crudilactis]|jgi:rhamnosyltransferase|uniref:glycosyltransferase n=1 Tax=Bifidobacterium crudilactis TaxID=327277 RepID=UPI003F9D43F0
MIEEKPNVAVLLSSYNGEQYIEEQVVSIFQQQNVDVTLFVRDDGSTDATLSILRRLSDRYAGKLFIDPGRNKGYKQSFLKLISQTSDSFDYYGFADQDDVWDSRKLISAIMKLAQQNQLSIYVSALQYVDEQLNPIRVRNYATRDVTLPGVFTRMRFAGCTMVFGQELFRKTQSISGVFESIRIPHDLLMLALCLSCGGVAVVDHTPYIFYRRSPGSLTSGGSSILKRLQYETQRVKEKDGLDFFATVLLQHDLSTNITRPYLLACASYRKGIRYRLRLMRYSISSTSNLLLILGSMVKITFGTF